MASGVVRSLHNDTVDRCVDIIKRSDGTFGFKEFRRDPEDSGGWTLVGDNQHRTYATEDAAIAAARAAVAWLRDQQTWARKRGMTQEIEIKAEAGVQVIRILRAEKKNAFTGPMYAAMREALTAAETDDAIACHLFIGSGGVFSAGNDINDFLRRAEAAAKGDGQGDSKGIPTPSLDFIRYLPKVTKPMIAAVDGLAIGVGATMLLHCDLIYATPAASLRAPFLDLGLVQEAGSSLIAPARLGYPRAFEWICLGEPLSAERALQAGLVNAVVPGDQLEATALAAARRLAGKPREALTTSRRLLRQSLPDVGAMIDAEAEAYRTLMVSPEAREAFAAFLEKRPPDFAKARQNAEKRG
jgi:enoyl-CoA hydratase/carnithine racemase